MTPVEGMYRDFCARMAKALEQEANSYTQHPALQDSDYQLIRALWDKSHQWKQQIEKPSVPNRLHWWPNQSTRCFAGPAFVLGT